MARAFLVAIVMLACGATSAAAATLYAARGQSGVSDLVILNQATGAISSTVGPIGFAVTGMDQHPTTGVLYAVTSSNSANCARCLITINVATGAGSLIGLYSIGNGISDIAFSPSGVLFGHSRNLGYYTLNLTTAAATFVGASVVGPGGTDFDSSGTLWFFSQSTRYTINPATGTATRDDQIALQSCGRGVCGGEAVDDALALSVSRERTC